MLVNIVPILKEEIIANTKTDPETICPSLGVLDKLVCISSHSNSRIIHNNMASLVANKLALRDIVLDKYYCPLDTKIRLRGSNFLNENLFGPLPESFRNNLSTRHGEKLVCKQKFSGKAQGNPGSGNQRTKPSFRSNKSTWNRGNNRRGRSFQYGARKANQFFHSQRGRRNVPIRKSQEKESG